MLFNNLPYDVKMELKSFLSADERKLVVFNTKTANFRIELKRQKLLKINSIFWFSSLSLLTYALHRKIIIKSHFDFCRYAIRNSDLDLLKWCRGFGRNYEHDGIGLCGWDEWTCELAAITGNLEILKWCRQVGHCPWDKEHILSLNYISDEIRNWIIKN